MWKLILLAAPAALGLWAILSERVEQKVAATLTSCLLVLFTTPDLWGARSGALAVAGALAVSAVGDWLLATKGQNANRFVAGIGAFLLAHVGYLVYALRLGRPQWVALAAALVPFLAYYVVVLRPRVRPAPLAAATLVYLVTSCFTVAAAAGLGLGPAPRILFLAGILWLVASDTVISLVEFVGWKRWERVILPTYYVSQLCIVASVMLA